MEASREKDAEVASKVFGLRVVALDWPCGYEPDGCDYEAEHFPDEMLSSYTERGPVYVPEHGIWPPVASPTGKDGRFCAVKPVPFYSTSWSDAALVLDELAKTHHWRLLSPFLPGEPWFAGLTPHGCTGWNGRPDVEASGKTGPEAICKAALAAKLLGEHGLSPAEDEAVSAEPRKT